MGALVVVMVVRAGTDGDSGAWGDWWWVHRVVVMVEAMVSQVNRALPAYEDWRGCVFLCVSLRACVNFYVVACFCLC